MELFLDIFIFVKSELIVIPPLFLRASINEGKNILFSELFKREERLSFVSKLFFKSENSSI